MDVHQIPGWGSDASPSSRPGVPKEWEPHPDPGAHWRIPERQIAGEEALESSGIPRVTPTFGTAQPARGLPGVLRRAAYRRPEYHTGRWALLMIADRIEAFSARARRRLPALLAVGTVLALVARELERGRSDA